ncbi:MAG: hypothetical protein ACXWUG_09660 [Polyangiales bacterium]
MKLALSLLLGFSAMACSSGDFAVSGAGVDDGGTGDSLATDDSGSSSDVATDTFVDPCAPEMGISKFCVDVKLERPDHPSYDAASGATPLGIDGKGIVYVSLFDKDPAADLMGAAPPVPKAVLQYPPADHVGEEADIDKDLPITLTGRAPAGTYWVITQFADNKTITRMSGESGVLPGDFVIVPNVNATTRKAEYPKLTLADGTTGRAEQKLRPFRRVNVDMGVTADLSSQAMTNPTIHGDGPVLFAIYDGDINAKPANVLSVSTWPCMAVNPGKLPPTRALASFGTTVDGEHNLLAVLFDYKVDLMGMANLYVQTTAGGVIPIPKVNISATSWVSSTKADFAAVYFPYDATTSVSDKNTCKGG